MHSWSAKGLPNYKHSEPFYLTKNMPQFLREENGFVFRWTKRFLEGGFYGTVLGAAWYVFKPQSAHVQNQMELAAGNKEMVYRIFRIAKMALPKYFIFAGSTHLLYWLLRDGMNWEANNNDYPQFIKHCAAFSISTTAAYLFYFGLGKGATTFFLSSLFFFAPIIAAL